MSILKPATVLAIALSGAAAFADYPAADIISLNISNNDEYMMTGDGETETLAGTLPDSAWQNTSNAERTGVWHSGDTRNGYRNGVKAWDGTAQAVTNLDGVVFSWAVEGNGTANYGTLASRTPVFRRAWLARLSGAGEFTSVVVQNIPWEKYDAIVYVSGNASATNVRAVMVNGVPYKGDTAAENGTSAADNSNTTWGNVGSDTLALGGNAVKVTGLTGPDLQVSMKNATTWGICAVQIVRDMSAGANNLQRAAGKVISVNVMSAQNSSGYTTGDIGLARVPAEAWTADGLSLGNGSNYDSDVGVAIKEWDGATGETTTLDGVTLHEKVKNGYGYGASEYVPQPRVLSGYADDSSRPEITVSGIPYKKYDAIVYCATDTENYRFGPVTVNGTPYRWSASGKTVEIATEEASTAATRWGYSRSRVMAYGSNALLIKDLSGKTLTIKGANNDNSARGGIAGFQIVDTGNDIERVVVEDGGTFEISAPLTEALVIKSTGSITIAGANGYTVTNGDLDFLYLDEVAGTVTLGAGTLYDIGTLRAAPEDFLFGEGSALAASETYQEYAWDLFSVSGLGGASSVILSRIDGTETNLAVSAGTASCGDGTNVKVTGAAALYDFQFDHTVTTVEGSRKTATMSYAGGKDPVDYYTDDGGIKASLAPWIDMQTQLTSLSEFSIAVYGTMPASANEFFVGFGSASNNGKTRYLLFLAKGAGEDEVVVGYGNESASEILATLTVPNATTAPHLYSFDISNADSTLTIYLDGMKWKKVTRNGGFKLGTSDHGGVQVASGFGGNPKGYTNGSSGVFYSLLIYDYVLTGAQVDKHVELYTYESPNGSFFREVSGEELLETAANTWTKAGEGSPGYTIPAAGSAVSMTAATDADIEVNGSLATESLSFGGDGAIAFKNGGGKLVNLGLTTVGTAVSVEAGAADLSGGPTVITETGSLHFDYSGFILDGYSQDGAIIPLTGTIDEQAEGVVTCDLPEGRAARLNTASLAYTNGCYALVVSLARAPARVYLDAGTTVLDDDTIGTIYTAAEGDETGTQEPVAVRTYIGPADTVCFSAADAIVESRTYPVTGFDFGEYAASVTIDAGDAGTSVTNSQTFTGSAGSVVKTGAGSLYLSGENTASLDIREGTLGLVHQSEYSFWNAESGLPQVRVAAGAHFDLNNARGYKASIVLAGTAQWENLGNASPALTTGNAQAYALSLEGDAYVRADAGFGLLANNYSPTTLSVGEHALWKTGAADFYLCNCSISGNGEIVVHEGSMYLYDRISAPETRFFIDENATLKLRTLNATSDFSCSEIYGSGTLSIGTTRPTNTVNLASGSSVGIEIVLASNSEKEISIPYSGVPRSVTVYEPDWSTVCTCATVSMLGGYIKVNVDLANLRRTTPATGGTDAANYDYGFFGYEDSNWSNIANWKRVSNNRWADYDDTTAPGVQSNYGSMLFDGNLMTVQAGADGYKSASVSKLEGWTLRVGAYNGAKVRIEAVRKQQGGCWYAVDETSKLILGQDTREGNNGGVVTFYIDAYEGVEFENDFNFTGCERAVFHLGEKGSVKFDNGATKGTQKLKNVYIDFGTAGAEGTRKGLVSRKIVSFNAAKEHTALSLSEINIVSSVDGIEPEASEADLTGAASEKAGLYKIRTAADGVYIDYIGYSANAYSPRFYLRIQ